MPTTALEIGPCPRPPAQSLHTTPPLDREARAHPAETARDLFLHTPLRSRLSLCVVSRVSFTCASHRRQLRYTGIELTVQRLVTIRAAGASSARERASPPRGALQARHVVSIQSSAIPSRVTARHQGARVQHTPRSVHRAPWAVVMFLSRRQPDWRQDHLLITTTSASSTSVASTATSSPSAGAAPVTPSQPYPLTARLDGSPTSRLAVSLVVVNLVNLVVNLDMVSLVVVIFGSSPLGRPQLTLPASTQ